jgi:hypothetical protein
MLVKDFPCNSSTRSRGGFKFMLPFIVLFNLFFLWACGSSVPSGVEGLNREVSRDRQGRIQTERYTKSGAPVLIRRYRRGALYLETRYGEKGVMHRTWYYENGDISDARSYKDGKPNGRWAYWDRRGELRSDEYYKAGKLTKKLR